ncbi:DUF1501 domain-containing protein [Lacihabitans sp. CCS-44]|uniref:DUF1501 domain-containing protein n=1 Tax=Lacihabitans sp. CCS-44 TaxID=2487331 RepID=UPI0020CE89C7|nr:DUF1501 domain-containing protein [Lacihabitans sp. CCS-44]
MNRRKFIKYSSATAAFSAGFNLGKIPVWAKTLDLDHPDDNVLVIIQMFGGNDALNTVIPADNDLYYSKFRKTLNIPKSKALKLSNTNSYLNPALKNGKNDGMFGLFKNGNLAVIQGVGYPNPNLSHFRSTDIWLSGITPANDSERLESGWLGRYFDKVNEVSEHPDCMNIGSSSSLLFSTGTADVGISVENPNDFYERGKDLLSGEGFLTGSGAYVDERNFLLDLSIQSNKYSKVVKNAFDSGKNTTEYAKGKLSDELKLVSRLISGGLKTKVYLLSIDGFDTHAGQGTTDGKHAGLLSEISNAVSYFMADLKTQNLSKNVLGMTVSEFGRRPNQNDSNGTDHGAAGVMFMFGEDVNGKVYGKALDFNNLDKNKDFVYQYDYRSVYDEVLSKWLGSDGNTTNQILGKRFESIEGGILVKRSSILLSNEKPIQSLIYPNPTVDGRILLKTHLEPRETLTVNQVDSLGRKYAVFQNIQMGSGQTEIPVQLIGKPGTHILEVLKADKKETVRVIWL